ncbi:MAG: hypothetical protein KGI98_05780 [Euryarchaeota archaeon]|nr:hypothetical protein [Euryarchaeota archaeon]
MPAPDLVLSAAAPPASPKGTGSGVSAISWWSASLPASMPPRAGAAVANDPKDGLTLVFGGFTGTVGTPTPLNDTWAVWYANQTLHRVALDRAPSVRSDAALIWDSGAGIFVLFGGRASPGNFDSDTWWFYPQNLTWRPVNVVGASPPARGGMAFGSDPSGDQLLIFGGEGYVTSLNDTWTYSVSTLAWTQVHTVRAPRDVFYPGSAATTKGVAIFGGIANANLPQTEETWNLSWPTTRWSNWTNDTLLSVPPGGREQAAMGWVPGTGDALLYGGLNGTSTRLGDLWSLNLTSYRWSALAAPPFGPSSETTFSPTGPAPQALWLLGGVSSAGATLRAQAFGGASPAPAPTLRSAGIPSLVRAGHLWSAWGNATEGGGFGIASVSVTYQAPGGGLPSTASLPFRSGTVSNGTVLSGNYSGNLAPFAQTGAFSWNVTATSTGGSQAWVLGGSRVVPANASLSGYVYQVPLGPSGAVHPSPIAGVHVVAEGLGSPRNWSNTTTLADGSFSLSLPAGSYDVTANRSGFLNETNASFTMGWAPASMDFFLPNPSGQVPNFNGTVGILGYRDRLVGVQVFANSTPPRYSITNSTNGAGTFNMTLVPGLTYNVTFTLPGFARTYEAVTINNTGSWTHAYWLRPLNPDIIVTVAMSATPSQPPPGASVTVNLSIRHVTSSGGSTAVPSGTVVLGLSWPPSNYVAITLASGTTFHGGGANITFTLPPSVGSHTNCTINATIASQGLPTVSYSIVIYVLKNYSGTVGSPPSPPLWQTLLPYVGIAVVAAVLVLYVLRSSNPSRVEEIFLVYKGGKLVWHASRTARADLEPEVVTGMLQAVEGFVERSFIPEGGHLNVLDFASMKLHIVRGHRLVAAVVLYGRNTKEVLRQVAVALEDMEKAWHESLIEWDGTTASLPHLRSYVDALLSGYYRHRTRLKAFDIDIKKLKD